MADMKAALHQQEGGASAAGRHGTFENDLVFIRECAQGEHAEAGVDVPTALEDLIKSFDRWKAKFKLELQNAYAELVERRRSPKRR